MASAATPAALPSDRGGEVGDPTVRYRGRQPRSGDRDRPDGSASATLAATSPVSVVRKKLPWLEKPPLGQKPAVTLQQRPQLKNDERSHAAYSRLSESSQEASIRQLGNDLALRAIGSTPSPGPKHNKDNTSVYSQSSQLTPESRCMPAFARRPMPSSLPTAASVSSEYSASDPGEDKRAAGRSSKTPPESFERSNKAPTTNRDGTLQSKNRAQNELDLPLRSSTLAAGANGNARSRGTKRSKPKPSLHRIHPGDRASTRRIERCKSCDDQISSREQRSARPQLERGSIASHESSMYKPPAFRPLPTKQSTLYSLPLHLMAASDSSSPSDIRRATNSTAPTPAVPNTMSNFHFPGPVLSTAGRPSPSEGPGPLNRAVTGLENLMGEALSVARDAAKSGRPDEVASLLNEATLALRQANSVHSNLIQPLRLSSTPSLHSSNTDQGNYTPNASSRPSREASAETLPTMFTRSSMQPLMVGHTSNPNLAPRARSAGVGDRLHHRRTSSPGESISHTPPRLYPAASAESVVRDFAYGKAPKKHPALPDMRVLYGAAASYYGDQGESVVTQPGVRKSFALTDKRLPDTPPAVFAEANSAGAGEFRDRITKPHAREVRRTKAAGNTLRSRRSVDRAAKEAPRRREKKPRGIHLAGYSDTPAFMQSAYFCDNDDNFRQHRASAQEPPYPIPEKIKPKASVTIERPPLLISRDLSLKHPRRGHLSIHEEQPFSLGRYHKRQPIAREWNLKRKRLTAMIACLNTIFIGLIAGIYAGEVPRIQYQLGDQSHWVIFGNMLFFAGLGLSTLVCWPLPLLHGRKPYVLVAFGIILPLQIPQAITVARSHQPDMMYTVGLLLPRALTGLALGLANINFLPTLWDLYGASLMSERPHQEIVIYDDVRRQGGGIGVWLGIWTFCFSSSLSVGFCVGACIISRLEPSWGFYIIILLLAIFLLINVLTPETRRAPYRRSISHFFDEEDPEKIKRRVARGEVKLHVYNEGPKWWYEEVWAGLVLTKRMICQSGFFVMMSYLGWIQAQLTLVILLLGALLSREYAWQSQWIGLAALAVPTGAILAMPLTKASWLSRERTTPPRTDSMTFQSNFSWSTHLLRRIIFSLVLPFAGLAYSLTATGPPLHWIAVIFFAGMVGFLTDLGIAECVGIIMETFDTCDLQPGINTKHRLQSMSDSVQRRRTNYSAFPRICAGFFAAQSLGFFLAAATTVAAGRVTNTYGTQTSIWIVAAILLAVTLLLMVIMWRWKSVQVISDYSGSRTDSKAPNPDASDPEWRPVVIGNPSGKMRRMNILELGDWTRWTEIRKLNKLIRA